MSLTVLVADGLITLQDRGRFGLAHLGVPRAGPLDAPAADLANRLVGNDRAEAVLEVTLAGCRLHADAAVTIAVTGAPCSVLVGGHARAFGEPVTARAGAEVALGPTRRGVRSYLAVAGGFAVEPVLGSRATDTLAFVGPPVVTTGRVLPVGSAAGPVPPVDPPLPGPRPPVLRVHPGPHPDWFPDDVLSQLSRAPYAVGQASNRVGLRLDGSAVPRRDGELASEGMVLGAIQVPPSGQPVVLLNDHPATGGYPVVGVVETDDLAVCAQLRPGEVVRLTPVPPIRHPRVGAG